MKVFFKTFGCRTNLFDTQVMKDNLKDYIVVENEDLADIIVVNSCTVTNGADVGVRQYVNKMSRQGKKIVFTGCGVKTQGQVLFDKNLIFGSFSHRYKEEINKILKNNQRFFYQESHLDSHIDKTIVTDFGVKVRSFIKIQEGCDFSCSYCIIPSVRGKARSHQESKILEQIKLLADNGIKEVVLTGTNVGSYGKDTETNLAQLIKKISYIQGIKRVRVGSLEPLQIDEEFLELLDDGIMEKHLHIALQHTHDKMLEIMNRRNRVREDRLLLEKIAQKGFGIGTDFIVAHPGESSEIWKEALLNFKALPLTHVHPFIYSKRDGTPSAKLRIDVDGHLAKERLHEINESVLVSNFHFRKQKKKLQVLVESQQNGVYNGLDQFFNRIYITSQRQNLINQWIELEHYEVKKEGNYAEI